MRKDAIFYSSNHVFKGFIYLTLGLKKKYFLILPVLINLTKKKIKPSMILKYLYYKPILYLCIFHMYTYNV